MRWSAPWTACSTFASVPRLRRTRPRNSANTWPSSLPMAAHAAFWKRCNAPVAESLANALSGKRIVITRAAEQSQSLLAALREKGAQPILLPMLAFAPPDDLQPLDDALRRLREYHWILFTSQNAVRALQERAGPLKLSLRDAVAAAQIAAVGPATANA